MSRAQETVTEKPVDETREVAKDDLMSTAKGTDALSDRVNDKSRLDQQQQRLLTELKGPPEVVWLDVDGQKVLGFWREDQSGKPVGAVVLLHAQGHNPRWIDSLLRMHAYLPLHGWATLSIELPELPQPQIPLRQSDKPKSADATTTPAPDTATVDETQVVHQESNPSPPLTSGDVALPATMSIADIRTTIQRRITAATQYLHQQGQYNLVLLGEGASALWALEHLDQASVPDAPTAADKTRKAIVDRAIRAVIMLDVHLPELIPQQELQEHLRHPQVPTLDIYTDLSQDAQREARQRKQISKKAGYEAYIQKRLPPAAGVMDIDLETNLTKNLRGFLKQHAQGEALD